MAGRLPLPRKNGTKIRVHFFDNLYPHENIIRNKKNFHRWTKKIPAKQHRANQPRWSESGLIWLCCLAGNFFVHRWNFFLMLIIFSYGERVSKKCTLIFVPFFPGKGILPATCGRFGPGGLNWLCCLAGRFYALVSRILKKIFLESLKHTRSSYEGLIYWRNTFI